MRLSSQEMRDVAYMYRIVEMARSAAVSAKDYVRFVPFLAKTVAHLSSTGALQESPVQYRIGLWYMMAHANYRIRKLKQAATCLDELEKQVPKNAIQQSAFYGKMVALRAAVASFTGENKLAIELVKQILMSAGSPI
jgi:ATP/maltotriose-dependent transcriptional regulator MalT